MSLESIQDAFQRPPILNALASHLRKFTSRFSPQRQNTVSDESLELSMILAEGPGGSNSFETGNRIGRVGDVSS
jgi:hypothetical protein